MLVYDIVVVGNNISAFAAVIYSAMSRRSTLHITCPSENVSITGVNNYLGYKEGTYNEFYNRTIKQISKFQVSNLDEDIEEIEIEEDKGVIRTKNKKIEAKAIILSTKELLSCMKTGSDSKVLFVCGEAYNGNTEMISLAGTGTMAAIDARMMLEKN
ncbi:hypothetical protein NEFER03_1609 [Nematocida sp. LUAm3]|nr:hypothetical protein NEFER03_1609 [Nematocida sp. LUAm3]KAI5176131.1 hypothetical protein NEFER02_1952 [Nematocida sp. LUAm2]KAI5179019.1 hypothetical protein NEFER01_1895 [Nematocida sp. LUAm1]